MEQRTNSSAIDSAIALIESGVGLSPKTVDAFWDTAEANGLLEEDLARLAQAINTYHEHREATPKLRPNPAVVERRIGMAALTSPPVRPDLLSKPVSELGRLPELVYPENFEQQVIELTKHDALFIFDIIRLIFEAYLEPEMVGSVRKRLEAMTKSGQLIETRRGCFKAAALRK